MDASNRPRGGAEEGLGRPSAPQARTGKGFSARRLAVPAYFLEARQQSRGNPPASISWPAGCREGTASLPRTGGRGGGRLERRAGNAQNGLARPRSNAACKGALGRCPEGLVRAALADPSAGLRETAGFVDDNGVAAPLDGCCILFAISIEGAPPSMLLIAKHISSTHSLAGPSPGCRKRLPGAIHSPHPDA